MTIRRVWRLGFKDSPCEFVPHAHCAWNHRFDDIDRRYRTLYCADNKRTCMREVLADLRPDATAIDDFQKTFGAGSDGLFVAGVVSSDWRKKNVLAQGNLICTSGQIVDVESISVRRALERDHAALLRRHGMKHLDLSEVRCSRREVTQTISRGLYNAGHAGIRFRSRIDNGVCYALFEDRAYVRQIGRSTPMTENLEELVSVAGELTLVLRPVSD